ncbi:olfactory receptor 5V1-like [Ambystoma mexicanum]|uniref:olfactory receptor 5V1-like n=1 Tax=Ambystoma mexicanum TaxID=8296 RepID=UPI0037E9C851
MKNQTRVVEFLLLGFSSLPELQLGLFVLFLSLYLSMQMGNILIVTITLADHHLHTPMYFFLRQLSLLEICYTSVTVPKMLANFLAERNAISFAGCAAQLYFFIALGSVECTLLAVMAYDRFVAICNPLCYSLIMSRMVCYSLVTSSWISGFLNSMIHTIFAFRLPFCASNEVKQFFCDIPPVLNLACADTHTSKMLLFVVGGLYGFGSFLLTLISYVQIISAILKIRTTEGRRKAFSTCTSHLIVVVLFYGTSFFMYLRPTSSYSLDQEKLIPVFYAVVTPTLNPILYSLRNKEMNAALRRMLRKSMVCYRNIKK